MANVNIMFQSDQICYAVLCVFSYIAAGQEQRRMQQHIAAELPSIRRQWPT
jgi:hypothetical protein